MAAGGTMLREASVLIGCLLECHEVQKSGPGDAPGHGELSEVRRRGATRRP